MASEIMMRMGPFKFGMNRPAYQTARRKAPYRWQKVDRIGRDPALQFTGPDTESITIEGVIYPHYTGGLKQIDTMRKFARLGTPVPIVDGEGFVWGVWAITDVEETSSVFLPGGLPRKIEFTVTVKKYGMDGWRPTLLSAVI